MSDGFAGDGGPPPPKGSGGKYSKNNPMYGFDYMVTREEKTFSRRCKLWYLPPGAKDKPGLLLDRKGNRYTCTIHEFIAPDGKAKPKSMVRCIARVDPAKGCPLCDALGDEGRWFQALSIIDQSKWVIPDGKRKGEVWTNEKKLVLVTSQQYNDMVALEEKDEEGWHGRQFDVTRDEDTKSSKIGTLFYPNGKKTDDELKELLKLDAESRGLTIEAYIEPWDYDQLIKRPTYDEAKKIAAVIMGTASEGAAVPAGDTGTVEF